MANTSCSDLARAVLDRYLAGQPVDERSIAHLRDCSQDFFATLVEGLADRFEPRLCDAYVDAFVRVYSKDEAERTRLRNRYAEVREPKPFAGDPTDVVVLSRVTLGADVVVTSRFLDAAKRRFPKARIHFAGSRKAWELFQNDERILHIPVAYPRTGSFDDRLAGWRGLQLPPNALILDPDSRITQLGVLPVAEPYRFFESRAYGGDSNETLAALAARWLETVLGTASDSYVSLPPPPVKAQVAISLGVGENAAKRIPGAFERDLIAHLASRGARIAIDKGAGGEEAERVLQAAAGHDAFIWDGAFAPFASIIANAGLYIGYDSAGQHVAAACGVPLVTVFAGYPCDRMFQRWKPSGRGPIEIVRVPPGQPAAVTFDETRAALRRLAIS